MLHVSSSALKFVRALHRNRDRLGRLGDHLSLQIAAHVLARSLTLALALTHGVQSEPCIIWHTTHQLQRILICLRPAQQQLLHEASPHQTIFPS